MMRRLIATPLILMAAMAALPTAAPATTVRPANLAEIVDIAATVVHVRVTAVTTQPVGDQWADTVTGTVLGVLAAPADPGKTISWHQPRLAKDSVIPAMPQFQAGNEYVVFLPAPAEGSKLTAPVALGHGAFRVVQTEGSPIKTVVNGFGNLTLTKDLDTGALAGAIAVDDEPLKAKSTLQGEALKARVQLGLEQSGRGPMDLELLAAAVRTLDKEKGRAAEKFARVPQRAVLSVIVPDEE